MKVTLKQFANVAVVTASVLLGMQNAAGLGHDFFTNKIVSLPGYVVFPNGFEGLVNATNRIAGYDVNSEAVFFFCGTAQDFTGFLEAYSHIPVADEHQLVLHDGIGEAKSPWATTGNHCDWKLYSAPKAWLEMHRLMEPATNSLAAVQAVARDHTNYVLVVHFWTGGRVNLDQVRIPPNVKVNKGE